MLESKDTEDDFQTLCVVWIKFKVFSQHICTRLFILKSILPKIGLELNDEEIRHMARLFGFLQPI